MAGNVKIASNSLNNGNVVAIEMNWTGDAINGSVPDTTFPTARYACDGFVIANVAVSIVEAELMIAANRPGMHGRPHAACGSR